MKSSRLQQQTNEKNNLRFPNGARTEFCLDGIDDAAFTHV